MKNRFFGKRTSSPAAPAVSRESSTPMDSTTMTEVEWEETQSKMSTSLVSTRKSIAELRSKGLTSGFQKAVSVFYILRVPASNRFSIF